MPVEKIRMPQRKKKRRKKRKKVKPLRIKRKLVRNQKIVTGKELKIHMELKNNEKKNSRRNNRRTN